MAGVLIKAHYGMYGGRAALVNLHSNSAAKAFGGLGLTSTNLSAISIPMP